MGVEAGYSGAFEHLRVVVGDGTVAGPLAKECCCDIWLADALFDENIFGRCN